MSAPVPACGDDAGALNPAGRRVPGRSKLTQPALLGGVAGGRACRSAGMVSRMPYGHDHGASNLTLVPDLGTQREAGDLGRPAEAAVRGDRPTGLAARIGRLQGRPMALGVVGPSALPWRAGGAVVAVGSGLGCGPAVPAGEEEPCTARTPR